MASIRQNPGADALPDFRNAGVTARTLIAVNVLAFGVILAAQPDLPQAARAFVASVVLLEPILMGSLVLLYLGARRLLLLRYGDGCVAVMAVVLAVAAAWHTALGTFADASLWRTLVFAGAAAAVMLAYLRLHQRAYSPALAEARLQALQARIRPHFLFNSLNAVLSLIRKDARRAEHALEDLSELFRALISDGRTLVRLADEIALLERYAAIEQLRLGDRMRIAWELDEAPSDALLPPMVLQPLLENAVHHGVEPATQVSDIMVRIGRRGDRVQARIENPYHQGAPAQKGNRMALENIRERLRLFFDAEATLVSRIEHGRYRVDIEIPYRNSGAAAEGARGPAG